LLLVVVDDDEPAAGFTTQVVEPVAVDTVYPVVQEAHVNDV